MTSGVGTDFWMAPEVIRSRNYGIAADIFALGVILTQLYTLQENPYAGSVGLIPHNVAHHGLRPWMPSTCPGWYRDLASACMHADPSQRPTAAQVVGMLKAHLQPPLPLIAASDLSGGCWWPQAQPVSFNARLQRMAKLQSAHTVPLLGVTSAPALVMAEMQHNLRTWLRQDGLTFDEALKVAMKIAEALAYLHAADVVHGHLVPTNVLVDANNNAVLSDFGFERQDDISTTNGNTSTNRKFTLSASF
ncbi:hypothetical protein SDRG_16993 [Saprolegnia diclina VS20]|uniref:Protein kinase domain-containing protein n=1 Tax=Saprolegnia diclina (strain VS20) TaxID=1156394 RepID=T0QZE5_SAPDV|nr:hypothetical protein SDRG_16993 [Saprolegnia diclina VS20]EQC25123.1 hypothetical protein SDRG_16993 [Saprolegnia diclina VS20]|eukprot:XP_008621448.1 hypothetical protein SDRG_16993 [Saprolegnia diclina VS20]